MKWSWCSISDQYIAGIFFTERFVCCMTKKSWAFSDLVAAISAALHESFVSSIYAYSGSQFLLYWMRIICCIYKDFVRQLKAVLPSFCHLCACEMSPGWGHLITWMDPSVGHLNGILAQVGGSLNYNFQKSQMPGGLPWAGGKVKPQFDRYITVLIWLVKKMTYNEAMWVCEKTLSEISYS